VTSTTLYFEYRHSGTDMEYADWLEEKLLEARDDLTVLDDEVRYLRRVVDQNQPAE